MIVSFPRAGLADRTLSLAAVSTLLLALVGTLALATPVFAQAPASEDPAVFGDVIDVRVVNVEVVVTDKDGIRVTGLAPGDFRLVVDGAEVPIDYFTEIRGGEAQRPSAAAEGAVTGVPAAIPGEPVGTSYLVFVDDFFAIERDRNRVLEGLREDLPSLGPNDRMAVVAFDGTSVEMLTTWTSTERELERALSDAMARKAYGFQRLGERRSFEGSNVAPGRSPGATRSSDLDIGERQYASQLERQIERSLSATVATLRGFAQPPGRKVMLLLSGGWPYSIGHYVANDPSRPLTGSRYADGEKLFAPLTQTANLLGYTVYPVDVPGLGGDFGGDVEQGGRTVQAFGGRALNTGEERFAENTLVNSQERERVVEDALLHVAQETGGRALLNSQKLDALGEVVGDTRSYYWLGFTPERRRDDASHEIRVEVRKAGLAARSRGGFLDMSPAAERDMATQSALLFGNPADASLVVELGEITPAGRRFIEVPIRVILPVGKLTALPTADGHVMSLELRFAALDESDRESEIPAVPIQLTFPEPPADNAAVPYDTRLKLRRQEQTLVVSLHDTAGERQLVSRVEVRP